jgi:uncharacterized membrane protein YccC
MPPRLSLLGRLRSMFADTDPGLLRLQLAGRGTLSAGLTAIVVAMVSSLAHQPLPDFAFGVVFSVVATFVLRDGNRRARLITLLNLLPPAAAVVCATSLIHAVPLLGEAFFLALVFVTSLLQTWHPRAMAMGMVAVVLTYVGLYLRLPPATLPWQLGGLVIGVAIVWLVCFLVLPLRPAATLRRAVGSVLRRAAAILHEAEQSSGASRALRRHLARLTEAALAAEDQLILLDEPSRINVRMHLFELEQAVRRLVAQMALGLLDHDTRLRTRLRLAGRRLRLGRPRSAVADPSNPLAMALMALSHAAAGLKTTASRAVLAAQIPAPVAPVPLGPLGWRNAAQVTLAALVAMLGGMALSPERWFWAVIAVYVVFLNARSRGDTVYKGFHRMAGTLAGLFGGLGIAAITADSGIAQSCAMLLAVFGMYYLYAVSYSAAIFCVTVLLGLVYGALGNPLEPLLLLRLEETALGVAAATVAASFFLPIPTHRQVRLSGIAVLRSLRGVVTASIAEPHDGGLASIAAVRRLDRQIADLRLVLVPLTAGRLVLRRARAERPMTALLACAEAARALAAASSRVDYATRMALARDAWSVDQRIAALIDGTGTATTSGFADTEESVHPALAALHRLDLSLAMLAERLTTNLLDGFAIE